jgi:threonine dehydrogenase-like Zn-dependent dehydrogenase
MAASTADRAISSTSQGERRPLQFALLRLLQHIEDGELPPDIISHRMKLADAARGHGMFEEMQDDCRRVVLTP